MHISLYDVEKVAHEIEDIRPDLKVEIDWRKCDFPQDKMYVEVYIHNVEEGGSYLCRQFESIFDAYPVLEGIRLGLLFANDKDEDGVEFAR